MNKKLLAAVVWLMAGSLTLDAAWTTKRLTNNSGESMAAQVAVSGSKVYVVWHDSTPGNNEIYFDKSTDGGATWPAAQRLTNNAGSSEAPRIAVSGSNVYVVWWDTTPGNVEIYFKKSADGGVTWQAAQKLTNNTGSSYSPRIAVSGSKIYVVWWDNTPGNYEIFFKKSTDGGATWQAAQRLTNTAGDSQFPRMAINGSNIYVVWSDNTSGSFDVFFRRSSNGGATWQAAQNLSNNAGSSRDAVIAVSGSNVYIAWDDNTPGKFRIYFRKSANRGATWQAAEPLTEDSIDSLAPDVAAKNSKIYLVWEAGIEGNCELFFKKSTNGGAAWKSAQRLTHNAGSSYYPLLALGSSKIYLVWNDNTPGNFEVYLMYSPL